MFLPIIKAIGTSVREFNVLIPIYFKYKSNILLLETFLIKFLI